MSVVTVASTSALLAALGKARDGDTIQLAAGTYSDVSIQNVDFRRGLTITSKDEDRPAVLTDLKVRYSSGLNFSNLEFLVDPAKSLPFMVAQSKDVHFSGLNVHGTLNGNPSDDNAALMIRGSKDVSVENSEFHELLHGISFLDSEKLRFSENSFHDIRTDGIRGGGASNVVVTKNSFTDFYPDEGDHPDAIQFWTTNTTRSAHDITITDNIITRGEGGVMQGIFLRDQVGNLPYRNVTIADNIVSGGMYNGIAVNGGDGVVIRGNTVVGFDDMKSWIRVTKGDEIVVQSNVSSAYVYEDAKPTGAANKTVSLSQDAGNAAVSKWLDANAAKFDIGGVIGAAIEKLASKEAPTPTPRDTTLRGTSGADRLNADVLDDLVIDAGDGDDVLTGGRGRNTLIGGKGDDTYNIKDKDDIVVEAANGGYDIIASAVDHTLAANVEALRLVGGARIGTGNALDNRLIGGDGADTLYGLAGDDQIQGQGGDDLIWGGTGVDELSGDAGKDRIYGEAGDDRLYGDLGDDLLDGGRGDDLLEGGIGGDTLMGGAGADRFTYRAGDFAGGTAAMDRIEDFSSREGDRIALSQVDANSRTGGANDKFSFIGTQNFHKIAGELRYTKQGGDAYVTGDLNGDGVADFKIMLVGVSTLSAHDFIL